MRLWSQPRPALWEALCEEGVFQFGAWNCDCCTWAACALLVHCCTGPLVLLPENLIYGVWTELVEKKRVNGFVILLQSGIFQVFKNETWPLGCVLVVCLFDWFVLWNKVSVPFKTQQLHLWVRQKSQLEGGFAQLKQAFPKL